MPKGVDSLKGKVVVRRASSYRRAEREGSNMTAFGDKLRALRKQEGLSLDRLAALTNSSKSYLWELENREIPLPSGEKLAALADALNTTVDALINDKVEPDAEDVKDRAFFRQFQKLDREDKEKLRGLVKVWGRKT
jgi:transcriptional regulator with XRE-family HTH domain